MVKYERADTEKSKKAQASLMAAKEKGGTYNTKEVLDALKETFHQKCYLCEIKGPESVEIEHFVPHENDMDLKYDWNNLYLSCRHCNNTKGNRYNPIVDCCKYDVDQMIAFRKTGYFGQEESITFTPLQEDISVNNTCQLLSDVFYGTTSQKQMEAKFLRRKLRKEMSKFKEYVREYYEEDGEDKEDLRLLIVKELKNNSQFTAFKRWLIRDNCERYADFIQYV